jgi:hypothetical protein
VSELELLLDDGRLDGTYAVERAVAPERVAAVVDRSDLADARSAIEDLCMTWGGACGALLPANGGDTDLPARWGRFLADGAFDQLAHRDVAAADTEHRRREVVVGPIVRGEPLLSELWGQREPADWPICDCSLPAPEDPWYLAYLACLGAWPSQPAPDQLRSAGLVDEFRFDQLLNVERQVLMETGPVDLIGRLRRRGHTCPAQLSCHGLALARLPEAHHLSDDPGLPHPGWERSRYGPNLVVVYQPGSVEDLALIWNLRAAHGVFPGVPLAVPATADVSSALKSWSTLDTNSWALRLFGLMRRPWGLVSATVDHDQLASWAEQADGAWAAADVDTVLFPGLRPSRPSKDVAVFRNGRARIAAVAADDREFLRSRPAQAQPPQLRVRLNPVGRHLPSSRTLARYLPTLWGYRGGGSEHHGEVDDILDLDWPSGWRVLEAAARDRGLRATPSRPGRAATALLRRLGTFAELQPLLDPGIIETVVGLGSRSGRAWFEQQIRDLHDSLDLLPDHAPDRSLAIEKRLADLALPPFEADRTELTWDGLQQVLSKEAAHEWLGWAESRELLVRGAQVSCDRCHAREWRPATEIAVPVVCRGCGHSIRRPFPADRLVFSYRASEALRQTLQQNALPHLLAARWLVALLGRAGLYGIHPGVEFQDQSGKAIAEVDIVLLFSDGSIALGECKLKPRGLLQADVDKLERFADAIGASWTFYAVPAWLSECGDPWQQIRRDGPERARFLLTNEQLMQPPDEVRWALGTDPWRPAAADAARRAVMHDQFLQRLAASIAWIERQQHIDDMLLTEE